MLNWIKNFGSKPMTLGRQGELWAKEAYKKDGFRILGSNVFNRRGKQRGEIDFIATKDGVIAFVEVKTRAQKQGQFGSGFDAVNVYKQQKLRKAVYMYLAAHPEHQRLAPRIDVCVIEGTLLDKKPKSVIILPNAVEGH